MTSLHHASRRCAHCGELFLLYWSNRDDLYCSGACESGPPSEAMMKAEDDALHDSMIEEIYAEGEPIPADDAEGRDDAP